MKGKEALDKLNRILEVIRQYLGEPRDAIINWRGDIVFNLEDTLWGFGLTVENNGLIIIGERELISYHHWEIDPSGSMKYIGTKPGAEPPPWLLEVLGVEVKTREEKIIKIR